MRVRLNVLSRVVIATSTAVMYVCALTLAPRAMSDPPALPTLPSVPDVTPQQGTITATGAKGSGLPPIVCTFDTSPPVYLKGAGQIATYGTVSCTGGTVLSITVTTQLWGYNPPLPSVPVGLRGWGEEVNKAFAVATSDSATCHDGNYFGSSSDLIVFPLGYIPPALSGVKVSPVVPIKC